MEELDDGAENFCAIVNDIAKDLGIKKQVLGESVFLTQSLKKKVEKATKACHDWERAHNAGSAEEDFLLRQWHLACNAARKDMKQRKAQLHAKEVQRVTKLFHDNEMKAFHHWESKLTKGQKADMLLPVMDKEGTLLTEESAIRDRIFEYYNDLK